MAKFYLSGGFIYPSMTVDWDDDRWLKELMMMRDAGMEYLVFMGLAVTRKDGWNTVLYPSVLPELEGFEKYDVLEICLRNCRKAGIKLILDTYYDDRWWDYGWEYDETFRDWFLPTRRLANLICDELLSMYGGYDDVIFAWYWHPEIWNVTIQNKSWYLDIVAEAMSINLDHYSRVTPGKPFLLSPFVNTVLTGASAAGLREQWAELIRKTAFRPGDILCPQDCVGTNKMPFDDDGETLKEWTQAYLDAISDAGKPLVFWTNNECFQEVAGKEDVFETCPIDRLIRQIEVTAPLSEKNITFAYAHYYSPYIVDPKHHDAYRRYLSEQI
jgi:hypothetical protein